MAVMTEKVKGYPEIDLIPGVQQKKLLNACLSTVLAVMKSTYYL